MSKRAPWLPHRDPHGHWCVLRSDKVTIDAKADRYVVPPNALLTEEEANTIAASEELRDAATAMITVLQYRSVPSDPLNPMHDGVFAMMVNALAKMRRAQNR